MPSPTTIQLCVLILSWCTFLYFYPRIILVNLLRLEEFLYLKTILFISDDLDSQPLRQKRLGHDLRGLLSDASEGIRAKPLDSSYYHWQASITGIIIFKQKIF